MGFQCCKRDKEAVDTLINNKDVVAMSFVGSQLLNIFVGVCKK